MINRPFKPPSFRRPGSTSSTPTIPITLPEPMSYEQPAKRRCISRDHEDTDKDELSASSAASEDLASTKYDAAARQNGYRKPLVTVQNSSSPDLSTHPQANEEHGTEAKNRHTAWYNVLWRKPTTKKHKTWDGDGTLSVSNGIATLRDTASGKELGKIQIDRPLLVGSTLAMAGREVEVDNVLKEKPTTRKEHSDTDLKAPKSTKARAAFPKPLLPTEPRRAAGGNSFLKAIQEQKTEQAKVPKTQTPRSMAAKSAFKNPLKDASHLPQIQKGPDPVPRHDPRALGALVMKRPNRVPEGRRIVDVVLDPLLNKHLREHQREGVKFLYECVMGLRDFNGEGAILADEMGLGKTLQTIALIWTLLKQNPVYDDPPVVKKALIVCPVTLINNWRKEFRKWLGNERIGVFVADGKKTRLTDFTMGKSYSVMIIGYERLRQVAEDLTKGAGIDIVIADEGHRLKTVQNKSAQAIQSLNTARRVILSGTPIQNDLSEFFSMVNFVNDGLLGSYKHFVKQFENPIVRSRQPNALEEHIEQGQECSEELARLTTPFILRRTAEILSKYLPPKTEYVLFCDPLPAQAFVYRNVISSPIFQSIGAPENALQLITVLKKLSNSPFLLNPKTATDSESGSSSKILSDLIEVLPPNIQRSLSNQASTKLRILDQLLDAVHRNTTEKVVIVSNYTSSLDLLAGLLGSNGLPFLRLDGSTPATKRQSIVDDFNRSSHTACFAFLLSAKAGGMGLNLIGASRLILFDVDWNPATDLQAMARIHREGQKRPCRIYRFILKGSVEERIWQRQVTKLGLADSVMEMGAGGSGKSSSVAQFSREELRDLFRLDENPDLRTHALLDCKCGGHESPDGRALTDGKDEFFDIDSLDNIPGAQTPIIEVSQTGSNTPVSVDDSDEDDLPIRHKLTKSSRLNIEEQERLISSGSHPLQANSTRKQKESAAQRASLMLYHHINVSKLPPPKDDNKLGDDPVLGVLDDDAADFVGDDILLDVLRSEGNRVSWIFRKTSENAKVASTSGAGDEKGQGSKEVSDFFK